MSALRLKTTAGLIKDGTRGFSSFSLIPAFKFNVNLFSKVHGGNLVVSSWSSSPV